MTPDPIVGRYAPSPTGTLHLGNLRTALAAWASARSRQGRFLLRIEDLDGARCKASFQDRQLQDLRLLGVDWDEDPVVQSTRSDVYTRQLDLLVHRRLVYPCFCSRKDIAEALSAPHAPAGQAYPGTCARLPWSEAIARAESGAQHCWRLRVHQAPTRWFDGWDGDFELNLATDGGDFVVRRADGWFAYQLACAVDDALGGVTEVVRARDLKDSGPRQAWLLHCLGLPVPRYTHIPMMMGCGGERLAKRIGSEDLSGLMGRGFDPDGVRSYLAWTLGLCAPGERLTMGEVAARWDWRKVPRQDAVHDEAILSQFRR